MRTPMIALLGAAVCCTQIVSAEVKITDNTSVDLYVQNGLIGHWDAVDNGGRGIHNTSATKWVNLAPADKEGRIDDITLHTAAIELRDNAIFKKGATITGKKSGLFGYLQSQPDNVATIEAAVSGITNAISDYASDDPAQNRRCLLSLVTITKWQQVFIAPDVIQRSYENKVSPEHLNDYALFFDDGAKQTQPRPSPSLSDRLDALTVAATYNTHQSGDEPCAYETAYANGTVLERLTGFYGSWNLAGQNENVTTFGGRAGKPGDGAGTIAGSVKNENMTRNYSMHSIRFYDRKLTADEVQWNAFVDHYRFEGAVSGLNVVLDGEGAYTVSGTFLPLDIAGDMTVKVTEVNAANESEAVQEFTIAPGEGGARTFAFTGRPPRCLVTVTVSQTYDGKTLEKSLSGFKTWEDSGTGVDVITWTGKWTNPITPWYASEDNWSENRFPINADKRINIGDQENESYAVRIGVPIALGPFANTLFVACKAGQSNRLEVVNGASLETKGTLVVSGSSTMTGSAYGELILSNGSVKAGNIYAGYATNKRHSGRVVVEGNGLLESSGDIWFGKNGGSPDASYSNVGLLIRGGTVRCDTTVNSGVNAGLFYGGPGMTIESGRIEAARVAFASPFNIYGGEVVSPVGLIFNNSGDGTTLTQTGGTVRAPVSADRQAAYYDMSGGELHCPSFTTCLRGKKDFNRAIRFRTIGSAPKVSIESFGLGSQTPAGYEDWFVFWDYALGADGRVAAHENTATNVFGYYHVAPLGGVQLIHSNCVTLVHNAEKDLVEDTTRWSGHGIETIDGDMWDYGISADKRRMEATLKPDFKLTNGALLDTSVDRGYLDLSDQLAPGLKGLKSVTVKLALEPQTGTTLNDIIAKINESGAGTASAIDEGDWNVQVEVPVKSVEKSTGERVVLDFTEYNTFKSTNDTMAAPTPTVRAKIKGARVTVLRKGLIILVT